MCEYVEDIKCPLVDTNLIFSCSSQAQVPKENTSNCNSAMLVGCGYKDVLEYR